MRISSFVTFWTPNLHSWSVQRCPCVTRQTNRLRTRSQTTVCATSPFEQKLNSDILERNSGHRDRDDLAAHDDDDSFIVNVSDDDDGAYDGVSFEEAHGDIDDMEIDGNLDNNLDDITVIDVSVPQREKRVRKRTKSLIEAISTQPVPGTALAADADEMPDIEVDESADYIRTAVSAADERKGEDIIALRVSKLTEITSFIVVITAKNTPQLRAISNLVEESLVEKHGMAPRRIDGVPNSGWLLLDYGDFLINIFSKEQRRTYNLESLWKRAEVMDISDCLAAPPDEDDDDDTITSLDDWLQNE